MLYDVLLAAALMLPSSPADAYLGEVSTMGGVWEHGWDTAADSWWGDFGYSLLSNDQAGFIASHYKIASLEKCTGDNQGIRTEQAIYEIAAQLKEANPKIKVLFYWSTDHAGIHCYSANATLAAHPEWWLRDDSGKIIVENGHPRIDFTNSEAAAWWVSVPLSGTNSTRLIDGVLADNSGYEIISGINPTRLQALYEAKLSMIQALQQSFDQTNGGIVLGNGLSEYDQSPSDPHNRRIINHVGAVQNEHYAAFEQVDPSTGLLLKDKCADTLANVEWAAQNATKHVFLSFWAGPYTGFTNGWPSFSANDPYNNTTPEGTSSQLYEAWRAQLLKYLPFNLASFLLVANERTYFTQAVWYELHQGFVPCPDAPDTCAAPSEWYSLLDKPLGPPLGPRTQEGAYRWRREFANATVTLDLDEPLGPGTSIDWH
eukprot:jgi/Bigna1/82827/fgenesh1_pg.98_\